MDGRYADFIVSIDEYLLTYILIKYQYTLRAAFKYGILLQCFVRLELLV